MNVHEINLFKKKKKKFHLPGADQSFPDVNLINSGKKAKAIPAVMESSRQENRLVGTGKDLKCYFISSVVTKQ